jgi:hypothetical protein
MPHPRKDTAMTVLQIAGAELHYELAATVLR